MMVVFDEEKAKRPDKYDVYKDWFDRNKMDPKAPLKVDTDAESHPSSQYIAVSPDYRKGRYVWVSKEVFMPMVIDKDLGDYL